MPEPSTSYIPSTLRRHTITRQIIYMRQCSEARADPLVVRSMVLADHLPDAADVTKLQNIFTRYTESCVTNYDFLRSRHQKGGLERKQFVAMCADAKITDSAIFHVCDCILVSWHVYKLGCVMFSTDYRTLYYM